MGNISRSDMEFGAMLLYNHAEKYNTIKICDYLNSVLVKCKIDKNDSMVDRIFKLYIIHRRTNEFYTSVYSKNIRSQGDIIDILTYKQSNDYDINILAKVLYYKYGKYKSAFLERQINKLINVPECYPLDLYEEYIVFDIGSGGDASFIPHPLTNNYEP